MATPPPSSTPKRKRGEDTTLSPLKFSFDLSKKPSEDGSDSPSSRVTHKFCGLALEGGSALATPEEEEFPESSAKRQKPDTVMQDASEDTTKPSEDGPENPELVPELDLAPKGTDVAEGLQKSYPSINRLSDSKSRVKKRSGTPPLRFKRMPLPPMTNNQRPKDDDSDDEMEIVDPVRAALTWHEDEITIYDPDDEDDDGTGINGVGFKPTPALAHARSLKRRQQMAEYRRREESDARTKRSQRRRGGAALTVGPENKSPSRKVRFMESEHQNIAITTG